MSFFDNDDSDESYNIGSSDIVEGDGSGIDISILFDTPQVYDGESHPQSGYVSSFVSNWERREVG